MQTRRPEEFGGKFGFARHREEYISKPNSDGLSSHAQTTNQLGATLAASRPNSASQAFCHQASVNSEHSRPDPAGPSQGQLPERQKTNSGRRHGPACESPRNEASDEIRNKLVCEVPSMDPIAARLLCAGGLPPDPPTHTTPCWRPAAREALAASRSKSASRRALFCAAHVAPAHSTTRRSPWPQAYHATAVRNGRRGSSSKSSVSPSLDKTACVEAAETQHLRTATLAKCIGPMGWVGVSAGDFGWMDGWVGGWAMCKGLGWMGGWEGVRLGGWAGGWVR